MESIRQCMSCRCRKSSDCFITEEHEYKSCQKCRSYQKDNRVRIASRLDQDKKADRSRRYYEKVVAQRVAVRSLKSVE